RSPPRPGALAGPWSPRLRPGAAPRRIRGPAPRRPRRGSRHRADPLPDRPAPASRPPPAQTVVVPSFSPLGPRLRPRDHTDLRAGAWRPFAVGGRLRSARVGTTVVPVGAPEGESRLTTIPTSAAER